MRGRMSPWWFAAAYVLTIVPADHVMATGMLRGLKRRVLAGPVQAGQPDQGRPGEVRGDQASLARPAPRSGAGGEAHT